MLRSPVHHGFSIYLLKDTVGFSIALYSRSTCRYKRRVGQGAWAAVACAAVACAALDAEEPEQPELELGG